MHTLLKIETVGEVELTYRTTHKLPDAKPLISSADAAKFLRTIYNPLTIEHRETFWMVCLNCASEPIAIYRLSDGAINATIVDVRILFQAALLSNATSILLSHNHPSGQLKASNSDISITKQIVECGRLLQITVLDHIIITVNGYYSFGDEGRL